VAPFLFNFQNNLEVKIFSAHTCVHWEASLERQLFYSHYQCSIQFLSIYISQLDKDSVDCSALQQLRTVVSVTGRCELLIFHRSPRQSVK